VCIVGILYKRVYTHMHMHRDQLAELSDKVPVPDMFKGPWRIFSGRFNGVEEMEARLAQRGEGLGGLGGDSISGDGVKEPYQRL